MTRTSSLAVGYPLLGWRGLTREDGKRQWGIILNTVKQEMKTDYEKTLEQLAAMGYRYLEGGVYGDSPKAYRQFTKSLGMKTIAGGSSMGNLQKKLEDYIKTGNVLRYKYITCYWPWLSSAKNLTKQECLETAERLNNLGRRLRNEGFGFTWHNHDKEFAVIEDKTAFEWLMENTDPDWVNVQMDLYWVYKGNGDPLHLMKKYPGRFKLLHIKDMDESTERGMSCPGAGKINFKVIFERWKSAGVEFAIVENERTTQGIACARNSINYLNTMKR